MRTIGLFLVALLLTYCSNEKKSIKTGFEEVAIERIYTDSVSIRALNPVDENRVWFAGNVGKVGLIDHNTPKLAVIRYEDSLLHFRSIAKTDQAVFVLSIANPGILYKIGFDGLEATSLEQVYLEKGEKVFYNAIKFWDNKTGIAMGDPTSDCLSVLLTNDSGNTWTKLTCEFLPEISEGEAAFAASNSNIAVYDTNAWIASGGKKARVFHTSNKGTSWEVYETPIIQGGKMTGIYSIDFYDENTGIIFGGDWENKSNNQSNKAITEDGGKTWKLVSDGSGPGYRSSVKFVPE
ncbi:oxidoreductase, partial [uncultured Planktosalinus sp.]|uniref:WD40/YVTN/BNR-like repeat-containing protein n=1 Tax=uncultured Planktosalinus sp. TaxID=1810935 RepID=UPI0030D96B83